MKRHEFKIRSIVINGRFISRVLIDQHVKKHEDITDDVIIDVVREMDGIEQLPDDRKGPYEYFATLVWHNNKQYRVVWLLEDNELYIGIITLFSDIKRKKS
jgi:hypothetical protein